MPWADSVGPLADVNPGGILACRNGQGQRPPVVACYAEAAGRARIPQKIPASYKLEATRPRHGSDSDHGS
jgi:hypothetical protein